MTLQKRSFPRIASKYRTTMSAILVLLFLLLSNPTAISILSGLPLVLIGEACRVWSSGYIDKNDRVAREGPYSLSRNPLYLGNFIIGLGFVACGGALLLLPIYLVFFVLIYAGTIRYEEVFLKKRFGDDYESYIRSVPRFIGLESLRRYRPGDFRFRLVLSHREYWTWLGLIVFLAVLWWKRSSG